MAEQRRKKPPAGNTLAARLARLGLRRDADFILHLPLRYEDETRLTPIAAAIPGLPAQFEVEVVTSEIVFRPRRQLVVRVRDVSGTLTLRFLNFYPSQQKVLRPGARLRLFGEVRDSFLGDEMIHPRFHPVDEDAPLPQALTPVYPTTAGLGQSTLRRLVARALERGDLSDTLPADVVVHLGLPEFSTAVRLLHAPPPEVPVASLESRRHPAWRRVQFDELLAQQLSLRRAYTARRARGAPQLAASGMLTQRLLASLPFCLTGAQQRAWQEIAADLARPHPMQRLLQGDVGSGKTLVAALAMVQAVEAGHQAALMAPTEILAEQHYQKLAGWLAPLGIEVAWLSGSLKKKDKAAAIKKVGAGDTPLAGEQRGRKAGGGIVDEIVDGERQRCFHQDAQHAQGGAAQGEWILVAGRNLADAEKADQGIELVGQRHGAGDGTMRQGVAIEARAVVGLDGVGHGG